ncbi:putative Mitochondrial fission process protein 1 [Glarea lozoyensis 74030]|uniref:Mitochondrial fission process protein 1 n=1 Tax=Glarea lozoyensis (strain ATCC 74030 / MF5533) TaxID=1104152 RepID=H0EP05_GLAL7|nr:putative Mitochondrial fission process protein 1 [Glarea lozoyensis 74030]
MAGNDSDKKDIRGPPPTGLPAAEKLPAGLQKIVDKSDADESFYDELYEGSAPQTTDTNLRYAAYLTRVRTALLSAQRYVAYTSDIGESFRPVAHPNWVRAAYGISWAYIAGDVAHEGYKAYCANQRVLHPDLPRKAAPQNYNNAQNTPAFTIHSIVRYSGRALKGNRNIKIRTYGPIGLGLAAVPALPYLFDKPVEEAVEWIFHKGFEVVGGKEAVGTSPSTGREAALNLDQKKAVKEKEL